MTPVRKSRWFTTFFARHARSRIAGTFGRVLVSGASELREASARGPLLVVANHTSWWDPLVALWLTNIVVHTDSFAMMDATNLGRLPFFGKVGAFGVDLETPSNGATAIRQAARLLDAPGRIVWIYPEGRERSPFEPLELRSGAALVGRVARRAQLVTIGVRYVFGGAERPDLWVAIGPAEPNAREVALGLERQRAGIDAQLGRIDRAIANRDPSGFVEVETVKPSVWGGVAERLLAWFVRFV